jgi:membrane protein
MADRDAEQQARSTAGARASRPSRIPPAGWRAVALRVKSGLKQDHVSLLAAGVAFKALLALFPALIAAISIFGLVADPEQLTGRIETWLAALPAEAASLIEGQLTDIAATGAGALSVALAVSIVIAVWSASGGVAGLMEGCNAAYNEVDRRPFLVKRGIAVALTIGATLFVFVAIGLIAVLPPLMETIGLGDTTRLAIRIGQWPLLAVMVMLGLAVVYRLGPDRVPPRARWITPGAAIATGLWLLGSGGFALYADRFGDFGETYGALAGVIVLMLWLMLSSFVVLLGAEVNAELERQTAVDTTIGEDRPIGERGAVVADTTPEDYRSPEGGDGSG